MEKDSELKLLRPRSLAAVVSDGYRLYLGCFRPLFRSSWIVAVVYGLTFALMMGYVVNNVMPMQVTMTTFGLNDSALVTKTMALYTVTTLLFSLAALLLAAQALRAFNEHKTSDTISRPQHWYGRLCLPWFGRLLMNELWMVVLSAIIGLVFTGVVYAILSLGVVGNVWKSIASLAVLAVLIILTLALLLPLCYTVMRSLLDKKFQWRPPVKGYVTGLRHWGLLFATVLVTGIITGLLSVVCELPAVIMGVANMKAYAGMAIGDPLGLPEHIVPLTYFVFAIAGFIQAYVHLSSLFPIYYAYGSIEQQEAERVKIDIEH
ncbi:MAG: hypothetical protein J6Z14_12900 [Prevotella sp.]|nr:hypothetical protein [Prevotella sp.]